MNGIDAAFFRLSVDLVLSTIRHTYISLPVVVLLSSLLGVSTFLCFYLSFSLSLCPSFFLSFLFVYYRFNSRLFLRNLPWFGTFFPSFVCFFLNKNQTTVSFSSSGLFLCCSLFPLWTLSSGRVSICCCNLQPRNLYLSGRKHRYGIWMLYWMAIREERSI